MKVVLISTGSCRPNKERCIRNIEKIQESFKGYDLETIFVGFKDEINKCLIDSIKFDNVLLIKNRPDSAITEFFPKVMGRNAVKGWYSQPNIFRFRQTIKFALDFIKETIPDCTHICLHRVEHRAVIDPSVFIEDAYNVYTITPFAIDDVFGFSNKEIFYKVWDYGDKEILKHYEHCDSDEELVRYIVMQNNIRAVEVPFIKYIRRLNEINYEDLYGDKD